MRKKKKSVEPVIIPLLDTDEPFVIYQLPQKFVFKQKSMIHEAQIASPAFGSRLRDEAVFIDNAGKVDVDMDYDYVRREEDKHVSEEEIIERFGSKYHEFQIINHEEAAQYLGGDGAQDIPKKVEPEKKILKKPLNMFEEDVDSFLNDEEKPEVKVEPEVTEEETEFTLNISVDDTPYEYGGVDEKMPKPQQTNIPSFLTDKPKEEPKEEPVFEFNAPDTEEMDLSFEDMPSMEAPEIKFTDNPPVDRNISIEEALRRANAGDYPTVQPIKKEVDPFNPFGDEEEEETSDPFASEMEEDIPVPQEEKKPVFVRVNKYENYSVDYESMFSKSNPEDVDPNPEWLEVKKEIINKTLVAFGILGEVIAYTKGPSFTLYEIMLEPGVNVKKINQIKDNLTMNLEVTSLRILCPIPGKNTIGIEAPNDKADVVKFGDIITPEFINDGKPLNVALGKNINGKPVYQDIVDMPHALIAGATKSGKSVSINTILVSLLCKNSPEDLKLILVDPKMVEMTFYHNIPHLAVPVITDPALAGEALKWACEEMDRRYNVFAMNRVRNKEEYDKKRKQFPELEKMPYILTIIDEFNDLIMQCGQEVNDSIVRLAQKARACGMHIILATQRPTVQVVSGTIKANVPCRIAFRVASQVDSNTILDEVGAENLLGRGDMLIKSTGAPIRAQGAYIGDDEIAGICDYLCATYEPDYLFNLDDLKKRMNNVGGGSLGNTNVSQESDELLYKIAMYCIESNACSINSIQNQFQLGFNRASRIVTMLEDRNIVSPKNGTKSREILVDTYKLREMFGVDDD